VVWVRVTHPLPNGNVACHLTAHQFNPLTAQKKPIIPTRHTSRHGPNNHLYGPSFIPITGSRPESSAGLPAHTPSRALGGPLPEHSPPFLCPRPLSAAPLSALASTRCVRLNPRWRLASGRAAGAAARGVEGGSWRPAAISPRPDGQAAAHLRLEAGAVRRRLL